MSAAFPTLDPETLKYFLLHSGVFIAALGVVFFLLGFWCGRKTPPRQAPAPVASATAAAPAPPTPPAPPAAPPAPPIEEKPAETAAPAAIEVPAPPPPPEPEPPQHIPIPWLEQPSAPQPAPEPAPPPPPESASPPSIPAPPEPEPPRHVPVPWLEQPPAPQPAPPPPPESASPPPFPMTRAPAAPVPARATPPPAAPGPPQDGVLKAIARSQGVILPPVDAFSFLLLDDAPPPPPRRVRPAPAALLFEPEDGDSGSDDLTRIRGITPELEAKLRSLGIRRWRQIATLTAAQVSEVSRRLAFKDRIEREGWQAQARALTAPGAAPPPRAGQGA